MSINGRPFLGWWLRAICLIAWSSCAAHGGVGGHAAEGVEPVDGGRPAMTKRAVDVGAHYIVTRSCEERRFSQSFELRAMPQCADGSCYGIECTRPENCTRHAFARCISSDQGRCQYGATATSAACVSDDECDRDPGGRCTGRVSYSVCQYNNRCASDADCPEHRRCDCDANGDLFCAFVGCTGDDDCRQGERCLRTNPCGWGPFGDYRCTTAADECEPYATGTCNTCDFDSAKGHWRCIDVICD